MKKKEINKKYNIKMILEEMYVTNDEKLTDAVLRLVILEDKRVNSLSKYLYLEELQDREHGVESTEAIWVDYAISVEDYKAMHAKIQKVEPEIKTGDYGYFWNDNLEIKSFYWGKLKDYFRPAIGNAPPFSFMNEEDQYFQNFSKTRPEWANKL